MKDRQDHPPAPIYKTALFRGWVSRVFRNVHPYLQNRKVLDIGCGDGTYLRKFSAQSVGIDISEPNLANCRSNKLTVAGADLNQAFPFKDDSFDTIFTSHVLEHVDSPIFFLRECHRILRKGGGIVICVPNESSLIHLFYPYFDDVGRHLYAFSPQNLRTLLERSGFRLVRAFPDFETVRMARARFVLSGIMTILEQLPLKLTTKLYHSHWAIGIKDTK